MKRISFVLIAAFCVSAAPSLAKNEIGTMERGSYVCELPADPMRENPTPGAVGIVQADENFTILSASRYRSPQGEGTYLRRGAMVRMTSGPRNGDAYRIVGRDFLRKLDENGEVTRLRCLRQG